MKEARKHCEKCASNKNKYYGDARNAFPNEMQECNCDGYHTFDELYEHRIALYIALCKSKNEWHIDNGSEQFVWRSKKHSDGELSFGGEWFVLGIGKEKGEQITYHLPISKWDETDFAETLEKAPDWDGHTSDDVLERVKRI